jgi:dTDP-glucose pyrophosphorylase
MAGAGKRFSDAGFDKPKPFIDVCGIPLFQWAVMNLDGLNGRLIFITQRELDAFKLTSKYTDSFLIELDGVADGAALSALAAEHCIDNNEPLIIINSDQVLEWNALDFMLNMIDAQAGLALFEADGDRWSYAKLDSMNAVHEVVEKKQISNYALTGVHFWKQGSDFVKYAKKMIQDDFRINGEFYIAPTYQYAIEDGMHVVGYLVDEFHDLGTPEGLKKYISSVLD